VLLVSRFCCLRKLILKRVLTHEGLASAEIVVTMVAASVSSRCRRVCRHLDWRVGDPAGADLDEVRRVRDDIERRVVALAEEFVPARSTPVPDALPSLR
jgi:protein-tyrosine-phosphatase